MSGNTSPSALTRAVNTLIAAALGAFILANYWPTVRLFELSRADLMIQAVWIEGHARQITAVMPGGVGDRAGLGPGDVLEFDPDTQADWVLAGYRNMPEGFRASLPVRFSDGTRKFVTLSPERVAYLPTLNDRLALLAQLCSLTIGILIGVFLVWARPAPMTWTLLLAYFAAAPFVTWVTYYLAFEAGPGPELLSFLPGFTAASLVAIVPFALCFPRDNLSDWPWWRAVLLLALLLAVMAYVIASLHVAPFERDMPSREALLTWTAVALLAMLSAIAALARTYRCAAGQEQARLKWALLGISGALAAGVLAAVFGLVPWALSQSLSGSGRTLVNWVVSLCFGIVVPLAIGYAVLRQRVVDVQFAVSRTLVYSLVSTLALVFIAAVHWVLGRLIEHSGLATGLEGIAAIGVGLVLHRASHGVNLFVDRVLFRSRHQAEQRLRRVAAALPFATDQRSIAEALVGEVVHNFDLASAALFYRDSPDEPFRRVLSHGWNADHAATLDVDNLLVRYLQAEHVPVKLDDLHLLPDRIPDGAALPVLAIPVVNQHALGAVILYGSHRNHTLPDPDEVELLHTLAKTAAASQQQVRIAVLTHEVATLTREVEAQTRRNDQLEAAASELRTLFREAAEKKTGRS